MILDCKDNYFEIKTKLEKLNLNHQND